MLGTLGLAGALVLGAVAPAWADPDGPGVPDSGSRPEGGALPGVPGVPGQPGVPGLPGGNPGQPPAGQPENGTLPPPTVAPPAMGPLATRIATEQQAVELLGERVKDAQQTLTTLRTLVDTARRASKSADDALKVVSRHTDATASEAYRESAGVPEELRDLAPGLQHLAPGMRDSSAVEGKAIADSYKAAKELADAAKQTLDTAQQALWDAADAATALQQEFERRSKALAALLARNAEALREAQQAADRAAGAIDYDPGGAVNGLMANPKALKAVRYAMAQLGKPYVWGDEGPNTFDCSGLVWAAYQFAGVDVGARTARAQYYRTRVVAPGHMLPGDLVFFGPNKADPESIHHVGIYIGQGKIVHAPTAGDVVKVTPIWWWEFFAATRVVPAVPAPTTPKPDPKPSPKPTPKPTPSPSHSSPSPSPSPTPSTTPSTDPGWTPAPGDSASPTPSDSAPPSSEAPASAPSGSESPSPAPGADGSAADGDTAGGDAAGGDTADGDAAAGEPAAGGSTAGDGSESPDASTPADCPSPSASPSPSPSESASASPSPTPSASASASPDPCADAEGTTAPASHSGDGEAPYPWLTLAPSQKAATIAARRRTTAVVRVRSRRRVR
ncbi:MAG: NlpC/P60 family protein [Micromonosporaceae bacterium]